MTILSGLGIVLSLVFGCLLLALVAELYYLLWWKKQRIINSSSNSSRIEENYSNHTQELFYLFCWDKPTSANTTTTTTTTNSNPNPNPNPNPDHHHQLDPDVELGLGLDSRSKDLLLKALGEDGVDLQNLVGPPRFLFTIKEETKEDLESEDGRSNRSRKGSRTRSLSDLIMALETQTPFLSPLASPPPALKLSPKNSAKSQNYNNPLFESSVEAELSRLRSSPPPKFKFLRDAEEKLYRKLLLEAQKSGILQEGVLDSSHPGTTNPSEEMKGKVGKRGEVLHCSSQVLPLASSPRDDELSENKPSLHH